MSAWAREAQEDLPSSEFLARLVKLRALLPHLPEAQRDRGRALVQTLEDALAQGVARRGAALLEQAKESLALQRGAAAREAGLSGLDQLLPAGWIERLANPPLARRIQNQVRQRKRSFQEAYSRNSGELRSQMVRLLAAKPAQDWYQNWLGGAEDLRRSLHEDLARVGSLDCLQDEDLRAVQGRLNQALQKILDAPRMRAEEQLANLEQLMGQQHYASALSLVGALETVSRLHHPTAAARARIFRHEIRLRTDAILARARSLERLVERPASGRLTDAALSQRVSRLSAGLAALPAPAEVSGLKPLVARLKVWSRVLRAAAGLRDAALLAARSLAGGELLFQPKQVSQLALPPRRLSACRGRRLLFAALPGRVAREQSIERTSVVTLRELLVAAERAPARREYPTT